MKNKFNQSNPKIIALPISKFIDTQYRDYAIYVITSRGIPDFQDSLTPIQRYILMNTPTSYIKTIGVVGRIISDHYSHGDISIIKSICKLARPYGNAIQILDGYGFFGTEVEPEPSAPRYTSIKLNSKANEIISKYKYLTTRQEEGAYHPFWMSIPIGLCTPIVGIAVGYKSMILPRKLEDIQNYLSGKIKKIKPYFEGFKGKIEKYDNLDKTWLISSNVILEGNRIKISDIPPLLKYTSLIKRLDWLYTKFEGKIKIIDNSKERVKVEIIYLGKSKEEFTEIQNFITKVFSILVTESIVFTKENQILTYNSVEEYLEDWKWQQKRLEFNNDQYLRNDLVFELEYNKAKEQTIKFILEKKRSTEEIDKFYTKSKFDIRIIERLDRLTSKKFTLDELTLTKETINELTSNLKQAEIKLKQSDKEFKKLIDPTLKRGINSNKNSVDLFNVSDIQEVNGIVVWSGTDVIDDLITEPVLEESEN